VPAKMKEKAQHAQGGCPAGGWATPAILSTMQSCYRVHSSTLCSMAGMDFKGARSCQNTRWACLQRPAGPHVQAAHSVDKHGGSHATVARCKAVRKPVALQDEPK
jgi:hypothetical protein